MSTRYDCRDPHARAAGIEAAVTAARAGELIVLPTDTVYGIGADGLGAIRAVERTARRLLRPGGLVAVEHGAPQGAAVYWIFAEEQGWHLTRNHPDLAGRDRFVTARRPAEG